MRATIEKTISPIKKIDSETKIHPKFLMTAERATTFDQLPQYYLVYFLLVDLLGFENLGRGEKIAWSVPIDFNGKPYLIEHRKFGFGIFCDDPKDNLIEVAEIASLLNRGVKYARPYFSDVAARAVLESKLNVNNRSVDLFQRYKYFARRFRSLRAKYDLLQKQLEAAWKVSPAKAASIPSGQVRLISKKSEWYAQAAIEAFFSWTEHVFIHLAILQGQVTKGTAVANLAQDSWAEKFKSCLDLNEKETKKYFDKLSIIKYQIRNFVAHGSFGKQGEAFEFHSGAGAVPVTLDYRTNRGLYALSDSLAFDDEAALDTIADFIKHLWSGRRKAAKLYLQNANLPTILSFADDGSYLHGMESCSQMKELISELEAKFFQAINMDW